MGGWGYIAPGIREERVAGSVGRTRNRRGERVALRKLGEWRGAWSSWGVQDLRCS